jgi:UDP-glucose 4-epimerase
VRALVTGGAGFIGSHVVDALLVEGAEVLVIDDLSTGRRENLAQAEDSGARLAVGDIGDGAWLDGVLEDYGPDQVFHLAAQADVRRAVEDPTYDARVNVLGTINVLEGLRRGDRRPPVVMASTGGAIYGEGEGRELPFVESSPSEPETAYGASKLAGEVYLGLYRRLHGLPGVALRLGNVYGPRQDPHGEAGVVAIFCGRLLEGRPATIFGDGRQTRDYVYVGDVVEALLAAASTLGRDGVAIEGPYNIGTGRQTSVLELHERLAATAGVQLQPDHRPPRAGEIEAVSIDPSAAGRDLGWRPSTGIETGLARTFEALASRR